MFGLIFLIVFFILQFYILFFSMHPIMELIITDTKNAHSSFHNNNSSSSDSSTSSTFVRYSAVLYDNPDQSLTFTSLRHSPPHFPSYRPGDKVSAYVSPDLRTIVSLNAAKWIKFMRTGFLVFYLIITLLSEILPSVLSRFSWFNPDSVGKFVCLSLPIFVGLGFTIVSVFHIFRALRHRYYRARGIYRPIHAIVKQVIVEGFVEHPTHCPVFSYNVAGTEKEHQSLHAQYPPRYYGGEYVTLYQDPETQKIFEPSDFEFGFFLIFLGTGILCLAIFVILCFILL